MRRLSYSNSLRSLGGSRKRTNSNASKAYTSGAKNNDAGKESQTHSDSKKGQDYGDDDDDDKTHVSTSSSSCSSQQQEPQGLERQMSSRLRDAMEEGRDDIELGSPVTSSASTTKITKRHDEKGHYVGERDEDGYRHGHGVCVYSKDKEATESYDGDWVRGQRHGRGVATWSLSMDTKPIRYDGDWYHDKIHGRGIWMQGDVRYVGDFKNGVRQGFGSFVTTQIQYDGQFHNGQYHGHGMLQSLDGTYCYDGDFVNGRKSGQGRYTLQKNGTTESYVGSYRDDLKYGKGTYTWPDQSRYVGEWRNGRAHGRGVLYFPDGERFEGCFHNDQMHGIGTRFLPNGRRHREVWRHGKLGFF